MRKKILPALILFFAFSIMVFTYYRSSRDDEKRLPTNENEEIFVKETSEPIVVEAQMSKQEARSIAEKSDCMKEGNLKENSFYNGNSKTWWFDIEADKPGCNPACVVFEDGRVEINWRCTGLVQD